MKILYHTFSIIFILSTFAFPNSWIRINQLGYIPDELKFAVLLSKEKLDLKYFYLVDAISDQVIWRSNKITKTGEWYHFKSSFRINFSDFKKEGVYYIKVGNIKSPNFRILKSVYNGATDFLLQYVRQQQCGYNPFLRDSCHTHDGFIIYHPEREGQHIDVVGGWHDASDYLSYVTTSATTAFQLLFSYYKNPKAFGDFYDRNGDPGSDGIPDVLNSANWGLEWLLKMNPAKNEMYNQIADDRDHLGFKLPTEDTISYGKGLERPVYFVTGEPQGLMRYKNRSDGVASTAAKFASTFAFASKVFENWQIEFRERLIQKSKEAYEFAKSKPGVCQTAPCRAPYFYEEENYVDDMALAAAVLNFIQNDKITYDEALKYLKSEPIVPWIGKDTARHYQWYPFVNLAHYFIAINSDKKTKKEIINYIKSGLDLIRQKAASNPFRIGIPFIWCSNNLISSILTQFRIYYELSGDKSYLELEAAHRDWLFGCNPWGTSMIVGFPEFGDFPEDPHSAFSAVYGYPINGGLVDGPVYTSIYKNLIGIRLYKPDEYKDFQTDYIVYHDDYGDYSTNEPTLDGTASLIMYLSFLHHDDENRIKNYIQNQVFEFGSTTPLINQDFTLSHTKTYSLLVMNKKTNLEYLFFENQERNVPSGSASVRVVHGAHDLSQVDITFNNYTTKTRINGLNYKNVSSYIDFPSGFNEIIVTRSASPNQLVLAIDATLEVGKIYTIYLLGNSSGNFGEEYSLNFLDETNTGGQFLFTYTPSQITRIRVINASPNSAGFDVTLDQSKLAENVLFGNSPGYLFTRSGLRSIRVTNAGTTSPTLLNFNFQFETNKLYSLILMDSISRLTPVLIEDLNFRIDESKAYVRFINASPNSPPFDIKIGNPSGAIKHSYFTYQQITSYEAYDPQTLSFVFTRTNSSEEMVSLRGFSLVAGRVYTIIVMGFHQGQTGQHLQIRWFQDN